MKSLNIECLRLNNKAEKIKTFRKPKVTVRLETVPALFSDETSKKVEDRKSILKVHVFDKNMGRHEAFKKLISAATDNLDTVKSLSSELKEVRKDSTNLEDRKNQITKLIKKLTEEGQIKISKIDNTDPPEYKIDASFEELKRVIAKSFPSITYGSQNSIAISAQFKSSTNRRGVIFFVKKILSRNLIFCNLQASFKRIFWHLFSLGNHILCFL